MLVPTYVDRSTQPSPAENVPTPEGSPSTPEASPPLDEPPVQTHGKARKRRRRKRTSQASAQLFAETQPAESQSGSMEQTDPSSQSVHLKPEDDMDHDPMDDIQVFSEQIVAISAHLEKSRSAISAVWEYVSNMTSRGSYIASCALEAQRPRSETTSSTLRIPPIGAPG